MTGMMIYKGIVLLITLFFTGIFIEDIIENIILYNKMDKNMYGLQHTSGLVKIFDFRLFAAVIVLWTAFYLIAQQ